MVKNALFTLLLQLRGASDRSRCSRHVQLVPPAVGAT
ncbi:MAG: hypothetical protein RLZZ450_5824 [Pseudomonadota bacterium]|jgi:hypothetical protein